MCVVVVGDVPEIKFLNVKPKGNFGFKKNGGSAPTGLSKGTVSKFTNDNQLKNPNSSISL